VLYRVETQTLGVHFVEGPLLGVQHAVGLRVGLVEAALPLREALVDLVPEHTVMGRKLTRWV
jgi:hypothetical protein